MDWLLEDAIVVKKGRKLGAKGCALGAQIRIVSISMTRCWFTKYVVVWWWCFKDWAVTGGVLSKLQMRKGCIQCRDALRDCCTRRRGDAFSPIAQSSMRVAFALSPDDFAFFPDDLCLVFLDNNWSLIGCRNKGIWTEFKPRLRV